MRVLPYDPPLMMVCASTARSSAVEKTPACPATPFSDQAFSSCTLPRTMPRAGEVWYSVAAIRSSSDAGGLYPVSRIPSGPVIRSWTTWSSGRPVASSTSLPAVIMFRSE